MISATAEQIDQTLTRIIKYNSHFNMNEKMAAMRNYLFKELLSPEVADEMAQWIEWLSDDETRNKILKGGDSAPAFTLTSADGLMVRLRSVLKRGPAVIIFFRGQWCSFDNLYLQTIQERSWEMRRLNASIYAITPQTPDHCMTTAQKNNLEFDVLSDIGCMVSKKFGLVNKLPLNIVQLYTGINIFLPVYNGDDSYELPMPGTFIIGQDGRIAHSFVDPDFTRRVDPEYIIDELNKLR